jgi:hypothetical protein
LTTPEGIAALEEAIEQEMALEGVETGNIIGLLKDLIPSSIVNLNTSYASLMENIASNIDAQAA